MVSLDSIRIESLFVRRMGLLMASEVGLVVWGEVSEGGVCRCPSRGSCVH